MLCAPGGFRCRHAAFCLCVIIEPGLMKLLGEGGTPKPFVMCGELKSSISLLRSIPVDPDMTLEPKLREKKKAQVLRGRPAGPEPLADSPTSG